LSSKVTTAFNETHWERGHIIGGGKKGYAEEQGPYEVLAFELMSIKISLG
jgi:hypothetical protein